MKRLLLFIFLFVSVNANAVAVTPLYSACNKIVGTQPENCAPALVAQDLKGQSVQLKNLAGKVTLLHFWASWCGPCKDELPTLLDFERQMHSGVVLVLISLDNRASEVERFFKKEKINGGQIPTLTMLLDAEQKMATLYGTFKVPETYIIAPDGIIKDKIPGTYDWSGSIIRHYIQCLAGSTTLCR